MPKEPTVTIAVRARGSLDERLTDIVYQLRRQGVRTSKTELVEMLIWAYVPAKPSEDFVNALNIFRVEAPRGVSGS